MKSLTSLRVLIILTITITPITAMAATYYTDGDKFVVDTNNTRKIYYEKGGEFEFILKAVDGGSGTWTYDNSVDTWTWSGSYSADSDFYFESDMVGQWLHDEVAAVYVKAPDSSYWTRIAYDPLGGDQAECYATVSRASLISYYGDDVGDNYYETDVKYFARKVFFSEVTSWYCTFTIKYLAS